MADDAKRWKGRRGAAALTGKRDQYLRLMNQGITNSEACRRVGINRRTGTRWRYGRTVNLGDGHQLHYAAVVAPVVVSERFLSEEERVVIADALRSGRNQRSIADELGRHRSTISREVSRNRHPETGEYRPWAAQHSAEARRSRPKLRKLQASVELREAVQIGLDQRWSPEQIERTLRIEHPERPDMHITAESIYQEIYAIGSVIRRDRPALRSGRIHRQRRRPQRRERFIAPMVMISSRPVEVEDRKVPGHWEGDLIIGANNGSAIATLVERTTRFTILVRLGRRRTSDLLREGLVEVFNSLPAELRRSLTWDQGIEMAKHHELTAATGMPVFFCDPGSPWQRPTNENTNGLLRQYFPKGTDLSVHTLEDLKAVAAELNGRPRKALNWSSPATTLATLTN